MKKNPMGAMKKKTKKSAKSKKTVQPEIILRPRGLVIIAAAVYEKSRKMLGECLFRYFVPYATQASPDGKMIGFFGECDDLAMIRMDEPVPRYVVSFKAAGSGPFGFVPTFLKYEPLPKTELSSMNPPPQQKAP